jgi:hypothetical protein
MNIFKRKSHAYKSDKVKAVFICNTPLHVYNALQAAENWGLDTKKCILVLKPASEKFILDLSLGSIVEWLDVVSIGMFPLPPFLKKSGNKKRIIQYLFFKDWQRKLERAKGCDYVFLCHNRNEDNEVIASYLEAKELVWLEDGTLSYFLWQEERIYTPGELKKKNKKVVAKKPVAKKPAAKKPVAKKPAAKKASSEEASSEEASSEEASSEEACSKKKL